LEVSEALFVYSIELSVGVVVIGLVVAKVISVEAVVGSARVEFDRVACLPSPFGFTVLKRSGVFEKGATEA
jgi:hypothetical protein